MKAEYSISEADYVKAIKLHARLSLRGIAISSAVILILVASAVLGPPPLDGLAVGGLIGLAIVIPIMRYVVTPVRSRMHYRRYKAIQGEFTVELLEDGIGYTSPNGEGILPWSDIFKWRQNEDYILVYPMPRLFYIVPKSVALQGFDVSALASCLKEKIGP